MLRQKTRNDRLGFTLAEVLVTLGIIGVVSAMTVPTLMQNYQKKSYVVQLHKVYNEIQQASLQYQTDRNAINLKEAGLISQENVSNWIRNYFKVIQDCGQDISPCFPISVYKKIDGSTYKFYDSPQENSNSFVLASGTSILVEVVNLPSSQIAISFAIDINGKQGPNIVGRDFFNMYLYNNNVIDDYDITNVNTTAPLDKDIRESNFIKACSSSASNLGHGCLGKILNDNWEMNY